jgi:sugar lactone lactonase YvrE
MEDIQRNNNVKHMISLKNETNNWELVTGHSCSLGECPVWDYRQQRICWIDITNREVHSYYPKNNMHSTCKVGEVIGAIALTNTGSIIAALNNRFATINLDSGLTSALASIGTINSDIRFNDGKCDPAGRFWAGTMSVSNCPDGGALYAIESDFTVKTKLKAVGCSNGLAWSPDNKILYYIDTPTKSVAAYHYDTATGNIDGGRIVIRIPEADGYPDGMTIDNEGMLWIALWNGWKIVRYNPNTGAKLAEIKLPVSKVTSCVFGGDTLTDLYITTAKTEVVENCPDEQPLSGCLFVIKNCGFKGLKAFEFREQ